jgi:hypothetical protein
VKSYAQELCELQKNGELIEAEIVPHLLCVEAKNHDRDVCSDEGVYLIQYSPEHVLDGFFTRLRNLADFMSLKPSNHGLWNIHLLNRLLYVIDKPKSNDELAASSKLSKSTVGSYLRLAEELLLVLATEDKKWDLTDTGKVLVGNREPLSPVDFISNDQSRILQGVIIRNPFASGAIFGIYTVVEAIFDLSKNTYPVPFNLLRDYFRASSGRYFEWSSKKTALDSMRMYSNYAIDIGLAGKVGKGFYLTPDGIRFILLLNLHKTIKIVDALGISKAEV